MNKFPPIPAPPVTTNAPLFAVVDAVVGVMVTVPVAVDNAPFDALMVPLTTKFPATLAPPASDNAPLAVELNTMFPVIVVLFNVASPEDVTLVVTTDEVLTDAAFTCPTALRP
jgi:hypothetical protein